MKSSALVLSLLCVWFAAPARAAIVVINNGLDPAAAPGNSLADATHALDRVFVRDGACGSAAGPFAACADPGAPTSIETLAGAEVDWFDVLDRSAVDVAGGTVRLVVAENASRVHVRDGLLGALDVMHSASARVSGGTLDGAAIFRNQASGLIEGGTCTNPVSARDGAALAVTGGDLFDLEVEDAASATLGQDADVEIVRCEDEASFAMLGGRSRDVLLHASCHASLAGGHVEGGKLDVSDSASVEVSGATIDFEALAFANSHVVIRGGTVGRNVRAHESATISIRGGVQQMGVSAWDDSVVRISGGRQSKTHGFDVRGAAEIVIYGSGFQVGMGEKPPGPVMEQSGGLSATLVDGTPIVSFPFTREAGATLSFAEPPPVFTSKTVQACAASKLKAFAAAAAAGAKCEAGLRKGRASLAKKRARLDPTALQAARDKIKLRAEACRGKRDAKLDKSWSKAQTKAEGNEPGACTLDGPTFQTAANGLDLAAQRLASAAAPDLERPDACLAYDAAAIAAAGRYASDALKAKALGFKKGLEAGAVTAAEARLAKSNEKLRSALAKIAAREAKAGVSCSRAAAENLIARADQAAFDAVEHGLGVLVP